MKRFSKIMGVVVTIALLVSMVVASVPASARPLGWSAETDVPKTTGYQLLPGSNISDIAVNGDVIYAATSNGTVGLVKSTDGGATWTSLASSTFYPAALVTKVAVSPDDPDVLVISDTANKVYYSENGGAMWSNLNQPGTILNIVDIDVSVGPLRNVVAVGNNGTGASMYTMLLAMAQSWAERTTAANTGFAAGVNAVAVKFSPNYQTDKIIGVVTANGTGSLFQVYWGESFKWNTQVTAYTAGYPVTIEAANVPVAASIAFPDTYIGSDYSSRIVYIGTASATTGGVYRLSDYSLGASGTFTTWSGAGAGAVGSISYDDSGKLLVGSYTDNKVYTCLNPTAAFPKFEREKVYKQPSGTGMTLVAWSGDTAIAATSGADSGFSMSTDNGVTWNDYALMDTSFNSLTDTDVSADGSMVYVVTSNGSVGDVWLKSSPWKRILNVPATGNLIVRVAPDGSGAVYVAEVGTQNVWVSQDGGMESWKAVPCYKVTAIVDMAVLDGDTVYMLSATGVSATTNGGASWGSLKSLDGLATASDIALTPNGDVLVGGTGGVAYSKDAGASFNKIIAAVGTGAVTVVADSGYESNNTIYAADDGTGNIYRLAADKGAVVLPIWAPNMITGTGGLPAATCSGMAVNGNVVYVLASNGTDSVLFRATNFQAASTLAAAAWSYTASTANLMIAGTPDSLVISDGPKLWAIDSEGSTALDSITDPIATTGPTMNAPAADYAVPVNPESGIAYNVNFSITRYASTAITAANIQIATDPQFTGLLGTWTVAMGASDTAVFNIGPSGTTFPLVGFNPGDTYYWRAQTVAGTLNSAWSAARAFKVDQVDSFSTTNPATGPSVGATSVDTMPTFTWAPYADAIGYEIVVSEDPSFAIIEWSRNVDNNFYKVGADEALKYSTTYYWRVRGVTGESVLQGQTWVTPAGPWITGVFTTMAEPTEEEGQEPIVITEPGETEVKVVEVPVTQAPVIPTYLLWVIVAVGAILVIALIVLIVRTRRIA